MALYRGWKPLHQSFGESHCLAIVRERSCLIPNFIERAGTFQIKLDQHLVVILSAIWIGAEDPESRKILVKRLQRAQIPEVATSPRPSRFKAKIRV